MSATPASSGTAKVESDSHQELEQLVQEISRLDKKRSDLHHGEHCGDEEVCGNEGGIFSTEFVCYCEFDQRWKEVQEPLQKILQQTSDFADTHQIYNREALGIHQRAGRLNEHYERLDNLNDINRQYITRCHTVAQSLGLVDLQLKLLEESERFEEGAELAMREEGQFSKAVHFLTLSNNWPRLLTYAREHSQEVVVLKTLLKMDDVDGALSHAESKALHRDALEILCSKNRISEAVSYAEKYNLHQKSLEILRLRQRIDDAVRYAEKYNLHDQAIEMLAHQNRFKDLFEYGAKHDCRSAVKQKSKEILDDLLSEQFPRELVVRVPRVSEALELCTVMESHQLQRSAAIYREVISESERRVGAKKLLYEYEERVEGADTGWFAIADLELSLGNFKRYEKIWKRTKEIYEQKMRTMPSDLWGVRYDATIEAFNEKIVARVSQAQSMIDNPRYYTPQQGLPQWKYSGSRLLRIALPLAELLEAENEAGEKKYPFLSLESVLDTWGTAAWVFLDLEDPWYGEAPGLLGKLAVSLTTIKSPEAFTFLIHHYPQLFGTNFRDGPDFRNEPYTEKSAVKRFNHLGQLLEYILKETKLEGESSIRKKIALENLLYIPAKELTRKNIFVVTTGGPDAVWKHIVSEPSLPTQAKPFLHDQRLQEIQQMYPHFNYDLQKRMKKLFFDAYTSSAMTAALDRALTLYMELKQAYGKPMLFPADHPLSFLRTLPQNEAEWQPYVKQVMNEIYSVPTRRKQVAEVALGRALPDFFEMTFGLDSLVRKPELAEKLTEFLTASPQQLDGYLQALKDTLGRPALFFELDATPKGEHEFLPRWTFLEHYDHFAAGILAERSSLLIPGILAQYVVTTARPQGKKPGIKERMLREVDAISYLFREMYQIAQSQTFKAKEEFRKVAVSSSIELWKEKQERFLPPEVAETMAHFNFNRFFGKDDAIQRYLEIAQRRSVNPDSLFADQPDILFSRILDPGYYLDSKSNGEKSKPNDKKPTLSDDFINAISRLKNGLSTSWTFDELRCEYNENPLHDFFNNAAECTGNGGKYQRYGYAHQQDRNIGILAANLYESGKYKSTIGKAFLARCKDNEDKELLYVDGVVMLQDIADFLEEPNLEARWLPLYTKAILQTALTHQLDEVIFNVSHKLAQRSVWQYIRHIAGLLGLEEGRDFTYKEGRVDDGSKRKGVNVKSMSNDGFELGDVIAPQHYHYLEKITDDSYSGKHLLEGFWINHHDPAQAQNDTSKIPPFVKLLEHSDIPQVNYGRGYIVGFRLRTEEWMRRYNEKYAGQFGRIDTNR